MARGETPKLARRAIITSAAGGLAAIAVNGLTRPDRVSAANGQNLVLGSVSNEATQSTIVSNPSVAAATSGTIATLASQYGSGVVGESFVEGGKGVVGDSYRNNGIGVRGVSNGHYTSVAIDAWGINDLGEGIALRARTRNGIALYGEAQASGGYGLQVIGRAVFNRSGKTTINAGQSSKTISGFAVTPATLVVATLQGNPSGVWVKSVQLNDAQNTFTIRLNKAAPSGGVTVGYFIVN